MCKMIENTAEIVSDKQEVPAVVEQAAKEPKVQENAIIEQKVALPEGKEVPEETSQDPNLLLSQAQAIFRALLSPKACVEYKQRLHPVLKSAFLNFNQMQYH